MLHVHTHQVDFFPLIAHEGPTQLSQIAVSTKQGTRFSNCDSFSTCSGKKILLWKLTQRTFDDRTAQMTITPRFFSHFHCYFIRNAKESHNTTLLSRIHISASLVA